MKNDKLIKNCVRALLAGVTIVMASSCANYQGGVASSAPVSEAAASSPVLADGAPLKAKRSVKPQLPQVYRPGLATGQGRELSSGVKFTSFVRASKKPKAKELIYYNDQEGVNATAGHFKYKSDKLQLSEGGLIEWGVKSNGSYLKNYQSGKKRFVVGKKGSEYALVLKNKCHSRLELVLSVDGLNVLNAKPASVKHRGYVIKPNQTLVIKGFRTSEDTVAAFKFSDVKTSYVNQLHGTTRNVGVVGLAVFAEKGVSPWRWSPKIVKDRMNADAF